jgi:hypothetical protein
MQHVRTLESAQTATSPVFLEATDTLRVRVTLGPEALSVRALTSGVQIAVARRVEGAVGTLDVPASFVEWDNDEATLQVEVASRADDGDLAWKDAGSLRLRFLRPSWRFVAPASVIALAGVGVLVGLVVEQAYTSPARAALDVVTAIVALVPLSLAFRARRAWRPVTKRWPAALFAALCVGSVLFVGASVGLEVTVDAGSIGPVSVRGWSVPAGRSRWVAFEPERSRAELLRAGVELADINAPCVAPAARPLARGALFATRRLVRANALRAVVYTGISNDLPRGLRCDGSLSRPGLCCALVGLGVRPTEPPSGRYGPESGSSRRFRYTGSAPEYLLSAGPTMRLDPATLTEGSVLQIRSHSRGLRVLRASRTDGEITRRWTFTDREAQTQVLGSIPLVGGAALTLELAGGPTTLHTQCASDQPWLTLFQDDTGGVVSFGVTGAEQPVRPGEVQQVCSRAPTTTTPQELSLTLDLDAIVSRYGSLAQWPGTSLLPAASVRLAVRHAGAVSPLGTATCIGGGLLMSLVPVAHDGLPAIDELRAHPPSERGFGWWAFAPAADRRVSFACVAVSEPAARRSAVHVPRHFVALAGPNSAPLHAVLDRSRAPWVLRASPDPIPRAAACCTVLDSNRPMVCDPSRVGGARISDGAPDCDGLYQLDLGRGSRTAPPPARPAQRGSRR